MVKVDDAAFSVTEDEAAVNFTSGALTARVNKKDWSLDFIGGGQRITGSGWRGMAYIERDNGNNYVREQLNLGVGECVYGLGERFTAFVKKRTGSRHLEPGRRNQQRAGV